ncbi:MAG: argininosuccinate lyase [Gammaproteobacteria bacterium]|nr:argininosuccinate lyase [Gammaproteobacteria bacterium]
MNRLWDKGKELDHRVLAFTAGEDHALDARLVSHDARASIAHAEMLAQCGLLPPADLERIREGLASLAASHARGEWSVTIEEEDGQTALESRLTALIGPAGGRIHLGRSRNDQVLAALRLYLKDAVATLISGTFAVADSLHALARRQGEVMLPGYTHGQQAMPSSVELWAHGFMSEVQDDAEGLRRSLRRIDLNPLGSAAGFGTPGLPISRDATRERLEFGQVQEPVTAVQLSRGKAEAQLLFEITLLLNDLGRLAADVLLFNTREFGFVELDAGHTTGSSIMPQKRNPDVFELVRGRAATATGCLVEALGIFSRLPSGYHRDLQLLKAPLFRGIDVCGEVLAVLPVVLDGLRFRPERIRVDPAIHATGRANALAAGEGLPFREAYRRVAAELCASVTPGAER